MTLESNITIPDSLFLQEVDDETILLDSNTNEYFAINEVGTLIWKLIEEKKDLKSVRDEIMSIYNLDEKQIENDILTFFSEVAEKGLIKVD